MATADESDITEMSTADIEATMGSIKKMVMVSALFAVVGYALITLAGLEEALTIWGWPDETKMWFKLAAVAHILIGVFISLVAIIRTLSLVPHRLGAQLE